MATYTDNYTMTKPTYAEQADISVINANMDIIDNVMHSSQISLAPAYDINETYNTGDIVMHELLMYKCLEDNVTGAWDSTKWTRTTAGEESGGGADLDIYGEASGTAEASFSDGAEASLVKCIVEIEATQSGSGTPSPSNVRPISGHSSITVTVASTSGGSGDDTTVSLGRTVYGGTLDVTTGVLTVTKAYKNLTTARNISGTYQGSIIYNVGSPETSDADFSKPFICNSLEYVGNNPYSADWKYGTCINAGGTSFNLWIKDGAFVDVADATTYLGTHPTEICYYLATPQTFTLTPTQVLTLLGQNYVSHDGGGTISLVYIKKDSTIIPNPSDAEVPLTGLEISGKDFVITDARIPAPPTTNGAYVLTVTVSGGTPTYSWENA